MDLATRLVGRQVGDFRLGEMLGEGGMGAAFRAEQLTLHREAVIKVISTPEVSEESKLRFLREARLASRLDHPYAAHVYAFGAEDDGLLWIAMELVRGTPLDRLIADQGPMPLARFVPFFDRLCEVVFSAHEQGIIHRDIKPSNIMVVRRAGRLLPKLLDFGIARTTLDVVDETTPDEPADDAVDGNRSITLRGRRIGSPEYMPPEMWMDSTRATPRSDLYALAITAYEVLTAKRPFTGPTVLAIAKAHARNSPPPVGPSLPPGLDVVFARALAKRADERYDNVLELDAAIREVARDTTRATATDLDEVVRETFIHDGPQPLSEALVELAAAHASQSAWEAGWRVVHVVVRLVGTIALAARAQLGERGLGDAAARVRALVDRGLDDEEWLALTAALVEPFAVRTQAHPVPELVTAFRTGGEAHSLFGELARLRRATDTVEAEQVGELLTGLARLLRACGFLTDYPWLHDGELWMGPRRQARVRRDGPAGMWLVDGDGAPLVALSPLVTVAPPSPGADDELFVIDGPARRGARSVAWPREFERFDDALSRFVAAQLTPLVDRNDAVDAGDVAPYRGLASFGPGDASMFFGREREVEAVVNRLRVQPLIAVVGPSGVGKSSFVHAGVLPALPETWQSLSLRPGASPLASLEMRLVGAGIAATGLATRLRDDPTVLGKVLDDAAHRQGARIVIVIDQLEEMFTQCRDVEVRDRFAHAIASIGGSVCVIFTLRDDFLVRAAELPGLGNRLQISLELVTLPDPAALRRIVVEPLRHVGYKFETEELPDEMVAAVREHPGALALLSFAAERLWELRDRGFHHIPRRAYDAIGGVVGALAQHAEETLSTLPDDDRPLVRELFRQLVTSEGTRATLYRAEAIQLLGKGTAAERVIEKLVERRLITGYEGDNQIERIEVVHEALLSAWPRLVTWQREDAETARMRDQVRSAARQWGERGRPKGLLWRGEALVELKLWRSRGGGAVTDLEQEFAAASVADETRSRRLRRLALATVVTGLVVGLVILQRANKEAERNAEASRRAALAMLVEEGRAELAADHPQEAVVYLSEAYRQGADDRTLGFMLDAGKRELAGEVVAVNHGVGLKWADLSPDGARIVSAANDGTVRIWNAQTGALEHAIKATGTILVVHPSFTRDNGLLTWNWKGEVPRVWDLATGALRYSLPTARGAMAQATTDGSIIVTLEEGKLRTWNAADGSPRGEQPLTTPKLLLVRVAGDRYAADITDGAVVGPLDFSKPPQPIPDADRAVFGSSGRRLASVDVKARKLIEWDVDHPGPPYAFVGQASEHMMGLEFSPDGTRLATTSGNEHIAKVWDSVSGGNISLDGHDGYVFSVAWSPDGKTVATGSIDRTVRLWDATTGEQRAVFYGHTDLITSIHFNRTGDRVLSASLDGTARVFDTRTNIPTIDLGHEGPITLRISRDDRRLLAVGHDHSWWVVDVATGAIIAAFDPHIPRGSRIAAAHQRSCGDIDATGETVVVPSGVEAHVIRLADPDHPIVLGPHQSPVTCAQLLSDGRIAVSTADGHLTRWSATGKREDSIDLHTDRIYDLAFDPHSSTILSAGDAVGVIASDASVGSLQVGSSGASGVAFSHDGTRIATASDTVASVFDAATHVLIWATHGLSNVEGIAFSPDDSLVATANNEGTVSVYDAVEGRLLVRFGSTRSGGWMEGIVVSTAGQIIAANDHGWIQRWRIGRETRTAETISTEVACHVPFELVGTHLIARDVRSCIHK